MSKDSENAVSQCLNSLLVGRKLRRVDAFHDATAMYFSASRSKEYMLLASASTLELTLWPKDWGTRTDDLSHELLLKVKMPMEIADA